MFFGMHPLVRSTPHADPADHPHGTEAKTQSHMMFRLSIRSSLAILVAVCLLPAAAAALGFLAYAYHQNREQVLENSLTTAHTIGHLVDNHFLNVEATLLALSTSPALTELNLPAFYWQATEAIRTQRFANIVLTDRHGLQLINTLQPLGAALPENGSSIRSDDFGDTEGAVISNMFKGKVAGRYVIAVAVPLRRDGQIYYGLSTGMAPNIFDGLLREQKLPARWVPAVIDRNGTIVARIGGAAAVGDTISETLRAAMADAEEGIIEGKTSTGEATYTAFKRSATTGWAVLIDVPTEHIAKQSRQALSGLFSILVVVLTAAVIVARLLGRRTVRSIMALTDPADALGDGNAVSVPVLPLVEADQVGKALVRASKKLEQARYHATHDTLTGLANRALFHEVLGQHVASAERHGHAVSVLYIDLDRFKPINDRYGHAAGDRVLIHVGQQLRQSLRESDFAARLGGDEFAVVLDRTNVEQAKLVSAKVLEHLSTPLGLEAATVQIAASIGIACYPQDGRHLRDLLHAADEAMYEAKARGENQIVVAGVVQELEV